MSPLVRSLLALAALLAAADAEYNCVTQIIGEKTDTSIDMSDMYIPYPGEDIGIDPRDQNCPRGMHHVGEKITVCNNSPQQREPEIIAPYDGRLEPVQIRCYDQTGCTAHITEYCGY